jgi:hypothetical protein
MRRPRCRMGLASAAKDSIKAGAPIAPPRLAKAAGMGMPISSGIMRQISGWIRERS